MAHINSYGSFILFRIVVAVVVLNDLLPLLDVVFDLIVLWHFVLIHKHQQQSYHEGCQTFRVKFGVNREKLYCD